MPELPEVEVLVLHLQSHLPGKTIRRIEHLHPALARTRAESAPFNRELLHGTFKRVFRRGKFIIFELQHQSRGIAHSSFIVSHLGMTGRMFLQPIQTPVPPHTRIALTLDRERFVFTDPRGFGKWSFGGLEDLESRLGPEPWDPKVTPGWFHERIHRSKQAIKPLLMNQECVAGLGNIYASESLFHSGIRPQRRAHSLTRIETQRLRKSIRMVLERAIALGKSMPLEFSSQGTEGLFYYGVKNGESTGCDEVFSVYDREGEACRCCGDWIRKCIQTGRSSYYCPSCQK